MSEENKRKIVIPGEVLGKGDDFLLGEGTMKKPNGEIVSLRYGLLEEQNRLLKILKRKF